jgi:hypothetical protein
MVALQTVQIPGYREAIRKERFLRDAAFLDGNEMLCGEEVSPLTLRRWVWLDQAHNGFMCPWNWDSDDQIIGHALAFVFFLKPEFRPQQAKDSFLRKWIQATKEHNFRVKLLRRHKPEELIEQIGAFIADAMMDAPSGGNGSNVSGKSDASFPAYIFDKFGEAGLTFTQNEILDMPLKRLWQHYRVACARCNDAKLTNPSDEVAVRFIADNQGKFS